MGFPKPRPHRDRLSLKTLGLWGWVTTDRNGASRPLRCYWRHTLWQAPGAEKQMASPIPRTLAEPAASAGPRAKSHWSKESTPRDSAKGAVPLQEVVCNLSLTRLTAMYARTIEDAPGAHEVDVLGTGRRRWRARSPRTSSPVGKTISDKAECQ